MMCMEQTDRIYSAYTRTNRRVRWQYAQYNGRWASVEEAIKVAMERNEKPFEYQIINIAADKVVAQSMVK